MKIFAVIFFTFLFTFSAGAETKWEGFAKVNDEGLPATGLQHWSDYDDMIRDTLKTGASKFSFAYELDKPSFKSFYVTELKQPKVYNRVSQNPFNLCESVINYFRDDNTNTGDSNWKLASCLHDAACLKEMNSKIKKISCGIKYGPNGSSPKAALANGQLKVDVVRTVGGDVVGWSTSDASKFLRSKIPLFDKTASADE